MAKVSKKKKKIIHSRRLKKSGSRIKASRKKILPKKKIVKLKKTKKTKKKIIRKKSSSTLERFVGNPVIFPARNTYWESKATFNPTAFIHDGKVHVVYRAVGVSDMSTLGYVKSDDGYYLSDRTFKPIFVHSNYPVNKEEPVFYSSGGGWNGGAEDPRITKIGDMLYLTYTAFDGWGSVRIGLTSISLKDFLNKKWNWKKPVLISPPG